MLYFKVGGLSRPVHLQNRGETRKEQKTNTTNKTKYSSSQKESNIPTAQNTSIVCSLVEKNSQLGTYYDWQ